MADNSNANPSIESAESPSGSANAPSKKEVKVGGKTREKAGEVLADIAQEGAESGTMLEAEGNVSESVAEGPAEDKKGMGGSTGDDDDQSSGQQGDDDDTDFIFDEKNLPPVDQIIRKIEKKLRQDVKKLEKQARFYKGGLFRKADYGKLNEVVRQIREKRVLIARLISLAADALKKMYIGMFKPKKELPKVEAEK